MSNIKFYFDLDDVFCDFTGGIAKLFNLDKQELINKSKDNDLENIIDGFWRKLDEWGLYFWSDLELNKETLNLWNDLIDDGYLCRILTSPTGDHFSAGEKIRWMKNIFGSNFKSFIITKHKYDLAKTNTILIDDYSKNINLFEKHGGLGYLFPAPRNGNYSQENITEFCDMIRNIYCKFD